MKLKFFMALALLTPWVGGTDARAVTTSEARVFINPDIDAAALQDGDMIETPDGRRYVYYSPHTARNLGGFNITYVPDFAGPGLGTYTYTPLTYAGDQRGAMNETRQIAAATAGVESALLNTQISERINTAMHNQSPATPGTFAFGNGSGMNAGSQPINVGIWGMYAYSNVKDNSLNSFKANIHSGTIGMDYLFNPCFLGGIAFTYGKINDGKYDIRKGKYSHDSYTAALYGSFIVHEMVSFDAMVAYGKVHKKFKEQKVNAIIGDEIKLRPGSQLEGSTSARRLLGSLFVNGRYNVDKFNVWARAGYAHTNEREDGFTLAEKNAAAIAVGDAPEKRHGGTVNIGNLKGNLRFGYAIHEMVTPYAGGGVNYHIVRKKINADFGPSTKSDKRFGWMAEGGLNLTDSDKVVEGNINYFYHKQGTWRSHNISVLARYNFR